MSRLVIFAAAIAVAGSPLAADKEPVPREMQAAWAEDGRCNKTETRFEITSYRAGYSDRAQLAVHYDPARQAVVWDDPAKVDAFVLAPGGKVLLHLTEGALRGPRERFVRCPGRVLRGRR
jgi:hypothetical protein